MHPISEFEQILHSLYKEDVEFMLTGGFAVNFHGYNRSTSDLDIWVKPVEENKSKIIRALLKIGFPPESETLINQLDFKKPFAFSLGIEPIDIDIFNHITGVNYDEANSNKIPFHFNDKLTVNYISLKDLIINKMLTGRSKDNTDVEMLQKIEKLRKSGK